MDTLATLFGSFERVQLLRFFFLNEKLGITSAQLSDRLGIARTDLRYELKALEEIGFIKQRAVTAKTKTGKKRTEKGWRFNEDFILNVPLRKLIINADSLNPHEILGRLKGKGSFSLVIASGLFIDNPASRADLLIVGDRLKRGALEETIREIEQEVGQELTYSILSTKEFKYRIDMYDKFVRDVLDFPHKRLVDRLEA